MQCFQKNPNLRISAKRLLKHPWISSAKRTVSVVPTKPTKYDEAVKSVQKWNEALKSPSTHSLRRSSRLATDLKEESKKQAQQNTAGKLPPSLSTTGPNTDAFRSPEIDSSDNWDDDFDSAISPSALHLPHLRPHDNFGGLLSSERLKQFANFESVMEQSTYLEEGDATVKSGLGVQSDPFDGPETVRPRTSARRRPSKSKPESKSDPVTAPPRQEVEPTTAFLRGIPKSTPPMHNKLTALSRPSALFRENTVEDYSDLLPTDETEFERKLMAMQVKKPQPLPFLSPLPDPSKPHTADSFSPKLFHPSDLKSAPRPNLFGSSRQRSTSSTSVRKMQRSQSEIEIQKYAEPDKEDFSDVFGHDSFNRAESDSGSEHSLAIINSKLYPSFVRNIVRSLRVFANTWNRLVTRMMKWMRLLNWKKVLRT